MSDEKSIRERAYALWEEHGRPHGRAQEHWEQARREIEEAKMASGSPAAKPQPRLGARKPEGEAASAAKRIARTKPVASETPAAKPKRTTKKR